MMTVLPFAIIAAIGAALFFAHRIFKSTRRHEWAPVHSLKKQQLIDGTALDGHLMTRTINGTAQYRRMSDDEHSDAMIDRW